MNHVLRHLRRAALFAAGEGLSDEHLLEAFLARRDEAAFEALLRRYGSMVFGVCQSIRWPVVRANCRGFRVTGKTMTHEDAFLPAVFENPDDDAPRLIYAAWLDETGQPEILCLAYRGRLSRRR